LLELHLGGECGPRVPERRDAAVPVELRVLGEETVEADVPLAGQQAEHELRFLARQQAGLGDEDGPPLQGRDAVVPVQRREALIHDGVQVVRDEVHEQGLDVDAGAPEARGPSMTPGRRTTIGSLGEARSTFEDRPWSASRRLAAARRSSVKSSGMPRILNPPPRRSKPGTCHGTCQST
jgi:hypothetical protein